MSGCLDVWMCKKSKCPEARKKNNDDGSKPKTKDEKRKAKECKKKKKKKKKKNKNKKTKNEKGEQRARPAGKASPKKTISSKNLKPYSKPSGKEGKPLNSLPQSQFLTQEFAEQFALLHFTPPSILAFQISDNYLESLSCFLPRWCFGGQSIRIDGLAIDDNIFHVLIYTAQSSQSTFCIFSITKRREKGVRRRR